MKEKDGISRYRFYRVANPFVQ